MKLKPPFTLKTLLDPLTAGVFTAYSFPIRAHASIADANRRLAARPLPFRPLACHTLIAGVQRSCPQPLRNVARSAESASLFRGYSIAELA